MLNRRQFLTRTLQGSSLVALNAMVPQFVARTAHAAAPGKDNILVVLEMTGGNDGLNTVIPYADDLYHKARPTLRQTKDDGHPPGRPRRPALRRCGASGRCGSRGSWRSCRASATRTRERSHFEAMDIWQSADPRGDDHDRLAGPGRGRDRATARAGCPILHIGRGRLPLALTGAPGGGAVTVNERELLPPRAGWGPGRAAEGPPPAAGGAGGTDREGRGGRPGLVRAATAGADADARSSSCASCSKGPTPCRGRATASPRSSS